MMIIKICNRYGEIHSTGLAYKDDAFFLEIRSECPLNLPPNGHSVLSLSSFSLIIKITIAGTIVSAISFFSEIFSRILFRYLFFLNLLNDNDF